MCGLAGFLVASGGDGAAMAATVARMGATLAHRGPDDDGLWVDGASGVALAFRRLSILDLTPSGHQPMASSDGRWTIVFNGEIYNFAALRGELEAKGAVFRGHSDSEVLAEALARWGLAATLPRLAGMFAFAAWDAAERRLHLVRDRLGVKPLYWGRFGGLAVFGSELKALVAHGGWRPRLHPAAAEAYFRFGYCPAPLTIYDGVRKVVPGTVVTLAAGAEPREEAYWSLAEAATAAPLALSEVEVDAALEALVEAAVGCRLVADVPVGAFLSGGIDSSLVVAVMQQLHGGPVRTYSIGFDDPAFDESPHARAVARHLGTDHTELIATPADARALVPRLADWYDEPFADSSQVPTALVARLARSQVTVVLTGDGGDELMGGYERYFAALRLNGRGGWLPQPLARLAGGVLRHAPDTALAALLAAMPAARRPKAGVAALRWLGGQLGADRVELYRHLVSLWSEPGHLVGSHPAMLLPWDGPRPQLPGFLDEMVWLDACGYLPDDILVKVDRATMAFSLEARSPFLDHRLVEWAWRLPMAAKAAGGVGKRPLRRLLERHLPHALFDRPKQGFGVPIGAWLNGPLRDWAGDLLTPARLAAVPLLDAGVVAACRTAAAAGESGAEARLWSILMFLEWHERWRPEAPA